MKIKYFSFIAEQSFTTSPSGERLFLFFNRHWSRPYIIPDQETEKRLFKKQLWMVRIFFGAFIFISPFLFLTFPNIVEVFVTPIGLVISFITLMFLYWLINQLVFGKDVQTLKRVNTPIAFSAFYRETAKHSSIWRILLSLLICAGFIWIGLSMISDPFSAFIGWFAIIFASFLVVLGGYTLFLKLTMSRTQEVSDNKTKT